MAFTCSRLRMQCDKCDSEAVVPITLWITSHKNLLVTGICQNCEKVSNFLWPLIDLFNNCPDAPPDQQALPLINPDIRIFTEQDLKDLHGWGVGDEQ